MWESRSAGLGIQRLDGVDYIIFTMPQEGASPGGHHVFIPIDLGAIGQLEYEAIIGRCDNDRCFVGSATASSNMLDNGEGALGTICNSAGQRVEVVFQKPVKPITNLLHECTDPPLLYSLSFLS